MYLLYALLIFFIVVLLYLRFLHPGQSRQPLMEPFEKHYIAHRGLFDTDQIPENSLPAFARAVEKGFGIELDVQLTKDHKLVVFHDKSLRRMCGIQKNIIDCSYQELQNYCLGNSMEKIPLFQDVLDIIQGKTPLIVEVKEEGDWEATTKAMAEHMDHYTGIYCMESFHPLAVKWFRDHRPQIARGLLSTNYMTGKSTKKWYIRILRTNLMYNFIAKPDFIAYNHLWKNLPSYKLCRKLYTVKNVAWTIRSQEELEKAKDTFDVFIFDSFIPS